VYTGTCVHLPPWEVIYVRGKHRSPSGRLALAHIGTHPGEQLIEFVHGAVVCTSAE